MEITIEEIARMLKSENGDVEAVKQKLADIKGAVKAQKEIESLTNMIFIKYKLSPLQSMCAASTALVRELDLVGKFFNFPKERRQSLCREVLEKTLETVYELEEEE